MAYIKPDQVVVKMIEIGTAKARLTVKDLLIRGFLAGAHRGYPNGTWNCWGVGVSYRLRDDRAARPGAAHRKLHRCSTGRTRGEDRRARSCATGDRSSLGMTQVLTKAVLCNWMVTLGVVMSLTSTSVIGKTVAMWLPILIFFAQGFEHSVVNMFLIPAGIILGAKISLADWWLWNQIPVTVGNLVGGFLFTGLALYATHHRKVPATRELLSETVPPRILKEQFGAAQE